MKVKLYIALINLLITVLLKCLIRYLKNDKIASLDHGNVSYTVWVSYSEIYNESIFDLLITNSANHKRPPLKLSLDQNKNVYVKSK